MSKEMLTQMKKSIIRGKNPITEWNHTNPMHSTLSGGWRHAGGCMGVAGTVLLVFIDNLTGDESSMMNSKVYVRVSAQIQPNAEKLIGEHLSVNR